jgi:hypothetical protein
MQINKSIYTHAAVFAIGVALAFVARRSDREGSEVLDDSAAKHVSTTDSRSAGESTSDSRFETDRGQGNRASREVKSPRFSGNPSQRMIEINSMGDPLDRQAALMELIKNLSPEHYASLADQYNGLDHFGNSSGEYAMILRSWAKVDPVGALEYTTKQPDSLQQSSIVLASWAGRDGAAAERWALENHKGDGPNPWMASVIRGIAINDIAHASELTAAMPYGLERGNAVEAVTRALLMQGKDVAMAYPDSVKDTQLRAGFVAMIADGLLAKGGDPQQTAAWLASFPDADVQKRSAGQVGEAMAKYDPAAAQNWVKSLSPEAQSEAIVDMVVPFSNKNITDTANWISTFSGVPGYDKVIEEFVWSCDVRAPEQSAAWISGITNEQQRNTLYHKMLGDWAKRDPTAVKTWVANNPVPNSILQRFNR